MGFACVDKPVRWAAPPTCSRSVSPSPKGEASAKGEATGARFLTALLLNPYSTDLFTSPQSPVANPQFHLLLVRVPALVASGLTCSPFVTIR